MPPSSPARTPKPKPAAPSLRHLAGSDVLAFDLSLTNTGYAIRRNGELKYGTISTKATGFRRLQEIGRTVRAMVLAGSHVPLVVFEGLSMGSNFPGASERIGLAYLIRMDLWQCGITFGLVPPSTLKKFATGAGNAQKDQIMLAVFQRWGHSTAISDEADACALLHYGLQLIGDEQPANQAQREALGKVEVVSA